jgi:hypothetical protein
MTVLEDVPMQVEPRAFAIEIGDWPGGELVGEDCQYPDAPDGGADLVLPVQCETHQRSIWWCLNAGVLWCDGGPPGYDHHRWPL